VFPLRALQGALAEYRAIEAKGGWPSVPAGATLRPVPRTSAFRRSRRGSLLLATFPVECVFGNAV
jgi:hypothetical protein